MSAALAWLRAPRPPAPSTLVLVAHPDDESAGAGARLGRLDGARLLYLTDGAPRDPWFASQAGLPSREAYAAARRRELADALAQLAVPPERVESLGLVDQEAAHALVDATRILVERLNRHRPAILLTQPYEGGHPDHDAAAFVAQAAARLCARPPVLLEMTAYHGRGEVLEVGRFLPAPDAGELRLPLSAVERAAKRRLLDAFVTQRAVLARVPLDEERYRPAPRYDFRRPPHAGRLHYERWGWPLDGARFRLLAAEAAAALGLT